MTNTDRNKKRREDPVLRKNDNDARNRRRAERRAKDPVYLAHTRAQSRASVRKRRLEQPEVELLSLARYRAKKLGLDFNITVEDIVIRNIDLSHDLEVAIEAKMVAEQDAAKARFVQVQAQVESETAVIRAKGEAEAIRIRGEALKLNPAFLRLQIVEKWNGRSPLVVPASADKNEAGLLLPIGASEKSIAP